MPPAKPATPSGTAPAKKAAAAPTAKGAPAAKKGKGAKAAAAAEVPQTDAAKLEVALAELEAFGAKNLVLEQQRGLAILERDRVTEFFEIARAEVEGGERDCRLKDVDLEKEEDRHLLELKELRQRIKHLTYGHDRFVISLKHETDAATAASADAARRRLDEDYAERASMKSLNREQATKHAEAAAAQSLETVKSLAKLRAELSQSAEELEEREAHCAAEAAAEAALLMRSAVAEVEERKDDHAAALNSSHIRAMTELKTEYEGALQTRIEAATAAKDSAFKLQQRAETAEAALADERTENENLRGPLAIAEAAVAELQLKLVDYDRTKGVLKNTKGRFAVATNDLKSLEWDHEVQRQELDELRQAHNILVDKTQATEMEAWRRALKSVGIASPQSKPRKSSVHASMQASVRDFRGSTAGQSDRSSLTIPAITNSALSPPTSAEAWEIDGPDIGNKHTFTVEEVFPSEPSPSSPDYHPDAASSGALEGEPEEDFRQRSVAGEESVDGDWDPQPEESPPTDRYEEESDRLSAASSQNFRGHVAVEV